MKTPAKDLSNQITIEGVLKDSNDTNIEIITKTAAKLPLEGEKSRETLDLPQVTTDSNQGIYMEGSTSIISSSTATEAPLDDTKIPSNSGTV